MPFPELKAFSRHKAARRVSAAGRGFGALASAFSRGARCVGEGSACAVVGDFAVCVVGDVFAAVAADENGAEHEDDETKADEQFHGIPPMRNFFARLVWRRMRKITAGKRKFRLIYRANRCIMR